MTKVFFISSFLLTSCAMNQHEIYDEDFYADGKYVHHIEIESSKAKVPKKYNGVWVKRKDEDILVGLTPLSTSLFKVHQKGDIINSQIYVEDLKSFEKYIPDLFKMMKDVFHTKKSVMKEGELLQGNGKVVIVKSDSFYLENRYMVLKLWIDKYEME